MRQIHLQRIIEAFRARLDAFFSLGALDQLANIRPSTDDRALLAEVEAAMKSNSYGAKFSRIIEDTFEGATAEPRRKLYKRTAILGTIFYDLFLLIDWMVVPDVLWLAVLLQIGIVTPIAIMFIVAVLRFRVDPELPTFICLVIMVAATIAIFVMSRSLHANLFACVFGLFLISGNVMLAMGFGFALAFSAMSVLSVTSAIVVHPSMSLSDQAFSLTLLASFAIYSLVGSYRIEAASRTAYLVALREGLRARLLDMSNETLKSLVTVDGLTGIGNRRLLDERLQTRWRQPTGGASLALLLIDIDHFKKFNDEHGHLMGDECLRAVAQVLAEEASGEAVTLARYGGEEFAVMIADAAMVDVRAFAERLRENVQALSIRTENGAALSVTVSIGCAAIAPSEFSTPDDLIRAADAALYRAKRAGRNCVEMAELTPPSLAIDGVDAVRLRS